MATHVYRLDVTYPPGSDAVDWEPPNWGEHCGEYQEPDTGAWVADDFRWPTVRMYLSRKSAENRAERLRLFGATVEVVKSERITWTEDGGES